MGTFFGVLSSSAKCRFVYEPWEPWIDTYEPCRTTHYHDEPDHYKETLQIRMMGLSKDLTFCPWLVLFLASTTSSIRDTSTRFSSYGETQQNCALIPQRFGATTMFATKPREVPQRRNLPDPAPAVAPPAVEGPGATPAALPAHPLEQIRRQAQLPESL